MSQITEWLPNNSTKFDSQYGKVTNSEWLVFEQKRIGRIGSGVEIIQKEDDDMMIALVEREG